MNCKIMLIFAVLIGILLSGCQVEKFSLPTWDVTLNVPLMNEFYYVSELIDSVNFYADETNNLFFTTDGDLRSEQAGEIGVDTNISTGFTPLLSGQLNHIQIPFSDVENGRELVYGLISSGRIWTQYTDINPNVTGITITFNEFISPDGLPLVISYDGQNGMHANNLIGYHVGNEFSEDVVRYINAYINVTSSLPDGTNIGNMNLFMNEELSFSVFKGRLTDYPMEMEDNTNKISIDYPWGAENAVELMEATINMAFTNPMSFDCELHGYFYAINYSTGQCDSIPVVDENNNFFTIAGTTNDAPAVTELVFTREVKRLLRILPERIEFRNAYFLISNSDSNVGEMHSTDRITGNYVVDAPLRFILHNSLVTPRDSVEVEISTDNRDLIENNALSANLDLYITNRLPMGGSVNVYLGGDPNISIADTTTWDFYHSAVLLSSEDNSGEQLVQFQLSRDEIMLFTNPKIYMRFSFNFNDSIEPVTITASPADYIRIRSMIKAGIHVEEQ